MKTAYFLFGVLTTLFVFTSLFDAYHTEFLDDYWINLLHNEYYVIYQRTTFTIALLALSSSIIWIYNLGKGTRELEEKEPLLIKKEEKEDE